MPSLNSLVDIKGGGTPSKNVPEYWNGDIPWASVKDFKGITLDKASDHISQLGIDESATNLIPRGNIIVPTRMALGKVAINTVDMAINQDLKALLIKDHTRVDRNYLLRCLQSKSVEIERQGKGATVKGIKIDVLKNLEIPLPPLETQKQIAAILEKADQLRKDCQQMEQELNNLAQSVFIDMFGDPVANPKGWDYKDIGSTFDVLTDYHANGSYEILNENVDLMDADGYALMVRTTDLENSNFENDVKYISEHAYNFLEKTKVFGGELIVNKIGSAGKVYLMPKLNRPVSLAMNQFMIRFKPAEADSIFMFHLLNTQYGKLAISRKVKGAVTKTIRKDALREIELPIPPIEKQLEYSEFIAKLDLMLQEQKKLAEEYECSFNALMQKAFKGELNLTSQAA